MGREPDDDPSHHRMMEARIGVLTARRSAANAQVVGFRLSAAIPPIT